MIGTKRKGFKMKHKDFEDFLMWEFHTNTEDGKMCLDDDLPDAFDCWLEGLDAYDWLELGDKYKKEV